MSNTMTAFILFGVTLTSFRVSQCTADEVFGARKSDAAYNYGLLMRNGQALNPQPDHVSIYEVERFTSPCTRMNLHYESTDAKVLDGLIKLVGQDERREDKLPIVKSKTRDFVIAFFKQNEPICWFVARRNYRTVTLCYESKYPDGQWLIESCKRVNDLEKWLNDHSTSFSQKN